MKPRSIIFVTGATGFVGGHFLRLARKEQWRLRCLFHGRRHPPAAMVEWIHGDLRRKGAWRRALKGCDAIVHLATASLETCERDPSMACETIVEGLRHLLQEAQRAGISRCVLASTSEVYGCPQQLPIHEQTALKPLSIYGYLKACSDLLALHWAAQTGTSLCILRFFNLYGVGEYKIMPKNFVQTFAKAVTRGKTIILHGSRRNSRDLIHVKDAANALKLALTHPQAEGVFNIGTGREIPLWEVAQRLAHLAGRKPEIRVQPGTGRFRRVAGNSRRARKHLGFRPKVSLDTGLCEVLQRVALAGKNAQHKPR